MPYVYRSSDSRGSNIYLLTLGQIGNETTDGSAPEGGKRKALGKKNNRSLRAAAGAGCSAWEGGGRG